MIADTIEALKACGADGSRRSGRTTKMAEAAAVRAARGENVLVLCASENEVEGFKGLVKQANGGENYSGVYVFAAGDKRGAGRGRPGRDLLGPHLVVLRGRARRAQVGSARPSRCLLRAAVRLPRPHGVDSDRLASPAGHHRVDDPSEAPPMSSRHLAGSCRRTWRYSPDHEEGHGFVARSTWHPDITFDSLDTDELRCLVDAFLVQSCADDGGWDAAVFAPPASWVCDAPLHPENNVRLVGWHYCVRGRRRLGQAPCAKCGR